MYDVNDGTLWQSILQDHEELKDVFPTTPSSSLCSIMYSSGTTGTSKGVMISHQSFAYVGLQFSKSLVITFPQRFFSYLPLSHIAERAVLQMPALCTGSSISFAESLTSFNNDMIHSQPTMLGGVPRIWEKLQQGVVAKLSQKKLNVLLKLPIVNALVRKSIQKKLGVDKVEIFVSGAAPTPVWLLHWYKTIGITLREMYGMTENTVYGFFNSGEARFGTVGQACDGVQMRLGDGDEVLLKTKALMMGYYKDEETTASVFTADGFYRTGDEGVVDADGYLTLSGRIKDQFKTDKGKFISPTHLEMKLLLNTDIEQACVVGLGIPQPVSLVVLSESGKKKSEAAITESLTATLHDVNETVESYERLACAVIVDQSWTIENGLMTPSLKIKRNEVEKIYCSRYREWFDQAALVLWT